MCASSRAKKPISSVGREKTGGSIDEQGLLNWSHRAAHLSFYNQSEHTGFA